MSFEALVNRRVEIMDGLPSTMATDVSGLGNGPTTLDLHRPSRNQRGNEPRRETTPDARPTVGTPVLGLLGAPETYQDTLQSLAEQHGWAVQSLSSSDELLSRAAELNGCFLVRMKPDEGLQLLRDLARRRSPLSIILFADDISVSQAVTAMNLGAYLVVPNGELSEPLHSLVESAAQASHEMAQQCQIVQSLNDRIALLTDNERKVLQMAIDGVPNKTIAGRLDIALRTVELRRQSIFRKLGCTSICDLVQQVVCGRELERMLDRRFKSSRPAEPMAEVNVENN